MAEGIRETATAQEWAVREKLTAEAKAFASAEVWDLWQKSARANLALEGYADEEWPELTSGSGRLAIEDKAEEDPELRRLLQASAHADRQLAARIRAELDVERRRRLRQRRQGRTQDSLPASFMSNPTGGLPPTGPE
jgi:hypothetical protein